MVAGEEGNVKKHIHSFQMRVSFLFIVSLIGISLLVVLFSVCILWVTVSNNAKALTQRQEEIVVNTMEQKISSIYQLGQLTICNRVLLEHNTQERKKAENYAVLTNDLYQVLLDAKKLDSNIGQIVLLKHCDQSVYQVGGPWVAPAAIPQLYATIMDNYRVASSSPYNAMKTQMINSLDGSNARSMGFFFPVFDAVNVYQQTGLLCIAIPEEVVLQYLSGGLLENIGLFDEQNRCITSTQSVMEDAQYLQDFHGDEQHGITLDHGVYRIWMRLPFMGWIVVISTTLLALVGNTIWPLTWMLALVLLFCLVISSVCFGVMKNFMRPLATLCNSMGRVARGDMRVRMDVNEYRDDEFREMSGSFNKMVRDVEHLMERIRDEQNQMRQIELNALQSQIKPHFLYNTLECIHWQALMEGDKNVSKLIKALANFYRLCLSKGQDLVSLRQEIAHVESYLVIQNMRYSDIVACTIDVPESLLDVAIPKMTLQPLVENAIYHGIRIKEGRHGNVSITAHRQNSSVLVAIEDDGVGMSAQQVDNLNATLSVFDEKFGYGVRNVNRRIEILFGEGFGLHYLYRLNIGCCVEIRIPVGENGGTNVSRTDC
ncbi:MAG: sensor histidine kinase [Rikenellaceae bacterium]